MLTTGNRRRTAALASAAIVFVAILGGTSYAATRPSSHHVSAVATHHSKPLTKRQIERLIKSYVTKHAAPHAIPFATQLDSDLTGARALTRFGAWHPSVTCTATAVSVAIVGPGETFGTNTLAPTDGGAGSSFETNGGVGGAFSIGTGNQGSQTMIVESGAGAYSVTYFANAVAGSPVECTVIGYATKLA
jgi:hypothetical protein